MARWYTKAELCNMLQDKLGMKQGSDNRRFTYPRCWSAIAEAIEQWVPWLPTDMQGDSTERTRYAETWLANQRIFPLPAAIPISRLISVRPLISGTYVELYGLAPGDPNNFGDKKAFDDRCTWLRRTAGIRLFCLVGQTLHTHPTPVLDFTFDVTYRAYLDAPIGDDSSVPIEKNAVPWIILTAAASGKLGDLRVQESLALLQAQNTMMKDIFGIVARENTPAPE